VLPEHCRESDAATTETKGVPMSLFMDETESVEESPGRFRGRISGNRSVNGNPNGGYLMAIMVDAALRFRRGIGAFRFPTFRPTASLAGSPRSGLNDVQPAIRKAVGRGIQKVADEFKGYQRERIGYCVISGSGVRIVRECSIA